MSAPTLDRAKNAGKWLVSALITVTFPVWVIPVLFVLAFCHFTKNIHDTIWNDEQRP